MARLQKCRGEPSDRRVRDSATQQANSGSDVHRCTDKSVGALCAWLTSSFGLGAFNITTHRQTMSDGSRSDPRKFLFDSENGFWRYYWEAYGKAENFLASLIGSDA
jgi:hypothetical protein